MGMTVQFGGYELHSLLGKGGMARVYRASRVGPRGFSKEVALKLLDPAATKTDQQIAALTDEARLGGLLRHPNIVATDEFGQVGQHFFIALELVDGWTLDKLLDHQAKKGVAVPRAAALEILISLCRGLAHAHSLTDRDGSLLHVVHRDVKPGNVMISRRGEVKVMDFGIAKAATNIYLTQVKTTRGTPLFMSPEQVMGEDLDARSDLFSLGGILQELVTLAPTFRQTEMIAVLRAVLDVDIGEAIERVRSTWPEILPVFLRCMQEKPDERYPDALTLARDLEQLRRQTSSQIGVAEWVRSLQADLPPIETPLDDFTPAPSGGSVIPDAMSTAGPSASSQGTPSLQEPSVHTAPTSNVLAGSEATRPPGPKEAPASSHRSERARMNRPTRPARHSSRSRKPTTWQRRAARRAAISRLLTLAALGLAGLFGSTFLPGSVGDLARGIWQSLGPWARAISGG